MIKSVQTQSFGSIKIHSGVKGIKGAERAFSLIQPNLPVVKATHFYVNESSKGELSCFAFKASKYKIFNKLFELFPEAVSNVHSLFLRPFGVGHAVVEKSHFSGSPKLRPQAARKLLDSANQSLSIKLQNRSNRP